MSRKHVTIGTCENCQHWDEEDINREWEFCGRGPFEMETMIGPAPWIALYGLMTYRSFGCIFWEEAT